MTTASEKKKLSKTPSWIMVGFGLGVLTMLGVQRENDRKTADKDKAPPVQTAPAPPPVRNVSALEDEPSLAAIEAVFAKYRDFVFWENDITEVSMWNSSTNTFADHFEVVRNDAGVVHFRSIPGFTRLVLERYGPPNCPLRFTETETMRAERLERAAKAPVSSTEPLLFPTPPPPEPRPERP